jgi:hypothetical protein
VTTIPENPRERHRTVTARLAAIDVEQRRLHEHERLRQEHLQRTLPEVEAALEGLRKAEERLARARSAHGSAGTSDLGTVTRQGQLAREREDLLAELADLSPWAPPADQGANA